jgi:regulation of enolase protein 1 (concanavalin A-like superfamily)
MFCQHYEREYVLFSTGDNTGALVDFSFVVYKRSIMTIDFTKASWSNEPQEHTVTRDMVRMITEPDTDLWQRSYYGFRRDNAAQLLLESTENFTFTTRVQFTYKARFDQCGVVIYEDGDSWFKASIEYEDAEFSRLGSVVTNAGHSDWATIDIPTCSTIWYRLSRRGPDFLIESSFDGSEFTQMRVFHLHVLGETTKEMGKHDPPLPPEQPVHFGLYACSPVDSSFTATFDQFKLGPSIWKAHG